MASEYLDKSGLQYLWGKIGDKIAAIASGAIHYGTCSTAAATAAKTVTINGITELADGLSIRVKFANAQTYNGAPTLNVNSLGAKNIRRNGTTNAARYEWLAGEALDLVYDGAAWLIVDGGIATTTYYGQTKLATSATSTSTALALTPASLNSLAQNMIANYPIYSTSATYEVGDRVRYSYGIYECISKITVAEAWNAAHWTALEPIQEQLEGKADASVVPAQASIDSTGLISFKNQNGSSLFTVQLPVYEPPAILMISFTINGPSYVFQAEDGMTWGEWCESSYNIYGFTVSDNKIVASTSGMYLMYDGIVVLPTDEIIDGVDYEQEGGDN